MLIPINDNTLLTPESQAALVASLAATGRVFHSNGGPLILCPHTGRLLLDNGRDTQGAALALVQAGLVQFEGARGLPVAPTPARLSQLNIALGSAVARQALPHVGLVAPSPVLGPSPLEGRALRVLTPGLHPCAGGDGQHLLVTGQPPALPTPDPALPHLHQWLSGLLLKGQNRAYVGNLLGWCAAALVRPFLPEFPILLIDATKKSCGKTRLAMALGHILRGVDPRPILYTGNEEEFERRLASHSDTPSPLILIDNIRPKQGAIRSIRSQALATAATCPVVRCRRMYRDPVPIFLPLVVATMNGGQVEPDLADRVWRVGLDRPAGTAQRRLNPDPLAFAHAHRLQLLAELLSILLAPMPIYAEFTSRFYGAETLLRMVCAALDLPVGLGAQVETADAAVRQLAHLVTDLGPAPVPLDKLLDVLGREHNQLRDLHEVVGGIERTGAGRLTAFRHLLEDFYGGQVFMLDNQRVEFIIDETVELRKEPHEAKAH